MNHVGSQISRLLNMKQISKRTKELKTPQMIPLGLKILSGSQNSCSLEDTRKRRLGGCCGLPRLLLPGANSSRKMSSKLANVLAGLSRLLILQYKVSSMKFMLENHTITFLKIRKGGWLGRCSVVKNACCSCRELKFCAQHRCWWFTTTCNFSSWGYNTPFWPALSQACMYNRRAFRHTRICTHTHN